jgi:hypothetical protein
LKQQQHSLKSLVYATAGSYVLINGQFFHRLRAREPGIDAGFADFHCLESIAAVGSCAAFERAVMSSNSPPNLRSISFQSENPMHLTHNSRATNQDDRDRELLGMLPFLRAPSAAVPASLQEIYITYQRNIFQPLVLNEEKKENIRATARALMRVHGASLTITSKGYGNYFPPILYGEPEPRNIVIYDGEESDSLSIPSVVGLTSESDSD